MVKGTLRESASPEELVNFPRTARGKEGTKETTDPFQRIAFVVLANWPKLALQREIRTATPRSADFSAPSAWKSSRLELTRQFHDAFAPSPRSVQCFTLTPGLTRLIRRQICWRMVNVGSRNFFEYRWGCITCCSSTMAVWVMVLGLICVLGTI